MEKYNPTTETEDFQYFNFAEGKTRRVAGRYISINDKYVAFSGDVVDEITEKGLTHVRIVASKISPDVWVSFTKGTGLELPEKGKKNSRQIRFGSMQFVGTLAYVLKTKFTQAVRVNLSDDQSNTSEFATYKILSYNE